MLEQDTCLQGGLILLPVVAGESGYWCILVCRCKNKGIGVSLFIGAGRIQGVGASFSSGWKLGDCGV